jgi:hypothetical protein
MVEALPVDGACARAPSQPRPDVLAFQHRRGLGDMDSTELVASSCDDHPEMQVALCYAVLGSKKSCKRCLYALHSISISARQIKSS